MQAVRAVSLRKIQAAQSLGASRAMIFRRVLLPASQRTAAGIEKKAVLLGMGNKFELWSEQAHLAKIRQTIGEDDITEEMADLRL